MSSKFDNLGKASESFSEAILKVTDSDWAVSLALDHDIDRICEEIVEARKAGKLRHISAVDPVYLSDTVLNEKILLPLKLLGYRVEYRYYIGSYLFIYISWDKKESWPIEWSTVG